MGNNNCPVDSNDGQHQPQTSSTRTASEASIVTSLRRSQSKFNILKGYTVILKGCNPHILNWIKCTQESQYYANHNLVFIELVMPLMPVIATKSGTLFSCMSKRIVLRQLVKWWLNKSVVHERIDVLNSR